MLLNSSLPMKPPTGNVPYSTISKNESEWHNYLQYAWKVTNHAWTTVTAPRINQPSCQIGLTDMLRGSGNINVSLLLTDHSIPLPDHLYLLHAFPPLLSHSWSRHTDLHHNLEEIYPQSPLSLVDSSAGTAESWSPSRISGTRRHTIPEIMNIIQPVNNLYFEWNFQKIQ